LAETLVWQKDSKCDDDALHQHAHAYEKERQRSVIDTKSAPSPLLVLTLSVVEAGRQVTYYTRFGILISDRL